MMSTINILGMPDEARRALIARAHREMQAGDERLARELVAAAARQFATQLRHHADEVLTGLEIVRKSLIAAR